MTPLEHVEDILRRCWWQEERDGPHPGFAGLDKEIERAIRESVSAKDAELARLRSLCEEMAAALRPFAVIEASTAQFMAKFPDSPQARIIRQASEAMARYEAKGGG